jgi:KaiC/GvpD/RAD55 family RecA-like ATPase
MKERILTGIPGLDQLLDGGLIPNRSILVQGGPGTGKSTFAMQYLIAGALHEDEPGVLISMEYETSDLISDMEKFGWPIRQLIKEGKLIIVTPPGGFEDPDGLDVDDMINFVHEQVMKIQASRLVIDSLNSLEVSLDPDYFDRRELLRFITLIRDLGCTTILVAEDYDETRDSMYAYLAHGVIKLYNFQQGANRLRGIEILKMRGLNHSSLTHSMTIDAKNGITVLPHEIDLRF